jgi:hypothetical protein
MLWAEFLWLCLVTVARSCDDDSTPSSSVKRLGICWTADRLLASQARFCFVQMVTNSASRLQGMVETTNHSSLLSSRRGNLTVTLGYHIHAFRHEHAGHKFDSLHHNFSVYWLGHRYSNPGKESSSCIGKLVKNIPRAQLACCHLHTSDFFPRR